MLRELVELVHNLPSALHDTPPLVQNPRPCIAGQLRDVLRPSAHVFDRRIDDFENRASPSRESLGAPLAH